MHSEQTFHILNNNENHVIILDDIQEYKNWSSNKSKEMTPLKPNQTSKKSECMADVKLAFARYAQIEYCCPKMRRYFSILFTDII